MHIAGTGIIAFDAKIKPGFSPQTILALHWSQASNGNWNATDRGTSTDYYTANDVRLYGKESDINNFINRVEANRTADSNVLTLTNINASEHIFGADVDYSEGVDVTVLEIEHREQGSLRGWGVNLKLRLLSPISFIGSPILPVLRLTSVGYDGDADRTVKKIETYHNNFTYIDPKADIGVFTGSFIFTDMEMRNLRRFSATTRGNSFSLTNIKGVSYPFGRRSTSYPYTVRLKAIENEQMFGDVGRWIATLTFLETV